MDNFFQLSQFILYKTFEHLQLTCIAIFFAMLFAIPMGIFLAKCRSLKFSGFVLRLISLIQTVPGLAFIAWIVIALVAIKPYVQLPVTGFFPGVIVLSVYAILPILSNTYSSIKEVSGSLIEVAKGLGMTNRQILFWVEVPISLPMIISGIRISLVWTVGMATLTSLVGSGGLGDLIMQGLKSLHAEYILAGTIPAAMLALLFDTIMEKIGVWLQPMAKIKKI